MKLKIFSVIQKEADRAKISTNVDLFIDGITRPNRQLKNPNNQLKCYPCAFCKGIFAKGYLNSHTKHCMQKKGTGNKNRCKNNQLSLSLKVSACVMDITDTISKLNVLGKLFLKMYVLFS